MGTKKKDFSLEPGGPKRVMVEYEAHLKHAEVLFDGQRVMNFTNSAEFMRGTTCKLPDGSLLTVKYGPIKGTKWIHAFKGVHLIRNGVPVAGSAAEPLPNWAWAFLVACGAIPFITMGGALPALLGFGGVTGVAALSRQSRWSVTKRVGVCAGITLACWTGLALLIGVTAGVRAASQGTAISAATTETGKNKVELSPNEELLHEIAVTYYQHGHITSEMEKMKDQLADTCDTMSEEACSKYLKQELAKVNSSPYVN
jgi:hypothetical protein